MDLFLAIKCNDNVGNGGKAELSITFEVDLNVFIKVDVKQNSDDIETNAQSTWALQIYAD